MPQWASMQFCLLEVSSDLAQDWCDPLQSHTPNLADQLQRARERLRIAGQGLVHLASESARLVTENSV